MGETGLGNHLGVGIGLKSQPEKFSIVLVVDMFCFNHHELV